MIRLRSETVALQKSNFARNPTLHRIFVNFFWAFTAPLESWGGDHHGGWPGVSAGAVCAPTSSVFPARGSSGFVSAPGVRTHAPQAFRHGEAAGIPTETLPTPQISAQARSDWHDLYGPWGCAVIGPNQVEFPARTRQEWGAHLLARCFRPWGVRTYLAPARSVDPAHSLWGVYPFLSGATTSARGWAWCTPTRRSTSPRCARGPLGPPAPSPRRHRSPSPPPPTTMVVRVRSAIYTCFKTIIYPIPLIIYYIYI